jgi:hypothetical protein
MAVKEVPLADLGKIAGSVAAVLALGWTLLQIGHNYLNLGERVETVEVRENKADEIHEATNRVLSKLAVTATAKEERTKARQSQCKKLIAAGKLDADDCDPGGDEQAAARGIR